VPDAADDENNGKMCENMLLGIEQKTLGRAEWKQLEEFFC
jgi:hypothetical protein